MDWSDCGWCQNIYLEQRIVTGDVGGLGDVADDDDDRRYSDGLFG